MSDPLQETIMVNLRALPNLEQQIEALKQTENFKDLGTALSPTIIALKSAMEDQTEKAAENKKHRSLLSWIKPKQSIKALDAFAGIMTLIIWLATSAWTLKIFSLTYGTIIGLAIFWLCFIVAFRLMIGGILD